MPLLCFAVYQWPSANTSRNASQCSSGYCSGVEHVLKGKGEQLFINLFLFCFTNLQQTNGCKIILMALEWED